MVYIPLVFVAILLVFGAMAGCPRYNVWQQEMEGRAALAKAEQDRQIKVAEARAKLESAKFESDAEIERARGVAQANAIIGDSLKGNDAYLRYLWIQGLNDSSGETIYVPTEANLPILEAGRRTEALAKPKNSDDE